MKEIQIPELTCLKCGYKWHPRGIKIYLCPKCHSYKWDEPKRENADDNCQVR